MPGASRSSNIAEPRFALGSAGSSPVRSMGTSAGGKRRWRRCGVKSRPSAPGPSKDDAEWETPDSFDATEPRLLDEVYDAENVDPVLSADGSVFHGALLAGVHP